MQAKASKCKTQASQVVQKTEAVNLTYFSQTTIICRAVSHQTSQEKKKKKNPSRLVQDGCLLAVFSMLTVISERKKKSYQCRTDLNRSQTHTCDVPKLCLSTFFLCWWFDLYHPLNDPSLFF